MRKLLEEWILRLQILLVGENGLSENQFGFRKYVGFADDTLVVCAAEDLRILKLGINESLWWSKRWLDSRGLKMALEKTEALLVTDRSFQYPRIVGGEHEVNWKTSIKYLGVQLYQRLSFGEHLEIATAKAIQWLGLFLTLVDPGKRKGVWWRAWCIRSCFTQLRSGIMPTGWCYPEEAVLSAERCCAENSFSL